MFFLHPGSRQNPFPLWLILFSSPLFNVTKIIKRKKSFFSQFVVAGYVLVRMGFVNCVSEISPVYNDNSNQCSGRRFNGLFWIAFDFSQPSLGPPYHLHQGKLLSIHHDYLIKKVFHFLFLGTQINARFSPIRLSFFNYCLLTNRTKQKFVIKFCAVAKWEKNRDKNGDWQKWEK